MINTLPVQGFILGAIAGALPGPVTMFILAQVIKSGSWAGLKVQLGATGMDVVRISLVFLLFGYITYNSKLAGIIAALGGLYLLYMSYGNFVYKTGLSESRSSISNPYLQGVVGNISNASAYIFWFTVGGPIILQSARSGNKIGSMFFALGFLLAITIIGALIAILAGRIKTFLSTKSYLYIIKFLGLVLVMFAFLFFRQSYQLLFLN